MFGRIRSEVQRFKTLSHNFIVWENKDRIQMFKKNGARIPMIARIRLEFQC